MCGSLHLAAERPGRRNYWCWAAPGTGPAVRRRTAYGHVRSQTAIGGLQRVGGYLIGRRVSRGLRRLRLKRGELAERLGVGELRVMNWWNIGTRFRREASPSLAQRPVTFIRLSS